MEPALCLGRFHYFLFSYAVLFLSFYFTSEFCEGVPKIVFSIPHLTESFLYHYNIILYMKNKPAWEKLEKEIKEAKKDPEFIAALEDFIDFHSGKTSQ